MVNSNLGSFTAVMSVNEGNYNPLHDLFNVDVSISSENFTIETIPVQSIPTQGNSLTTLEICF